jgi:hypothetical protein
LPSGRELNPVAAEKAAKSRRVTSSRKRRELLFDAPGCKGYTCSCDRCAAQRGERIGKNWDRRQPWLPRAPIHRGGPSPPPLPFGFEFRERRQPGKEPTWYDGNIPRGRNIALWVEEQGRRRRPKRTTVIAHLVGRPDCRLLIRPGTGMLHLKRRPVGERAMNPFPGRLHNLFSDPPRRSSAERQAMQLRSILGSRCAELGRPAPARRSRLTVRRPRPSPASSRAAEPALETRTRPQGASKVLTQALTRAHNDAQTPTVPHKKTPP